jgi:hypothetical protein
VVVGSLAVAVVVAADFPQFDEQPDFDEDRERGGRAITIATIATIGTNVIHTGRQVEGPGKITGIVGGSGWGDWATSIGLTTTVKPMWANSWSWRNWGKRRESTSATIEIVLIPGRWGFVILFLVLWRWWLVVVVGLLLLLPIVVVVVVVLLRILSKAKKLLVLMGEGSHLSRQSLDGPI